MVHTFHQQLDPWNGLYHSVHSEMSLKMTFSALLIWTFGGHYHENQAIPPDQDGAALVDMSTEHADPEWFDN
jgi:hypothetical protein